MNTTTKPINYYRDLGRLTRKPGNLAAQALNAANLHALFSLARCSSCGHNTEEAGTLTAHGEGEFYCPGCW
jgi:hypothetical protein